MEIHPFIGNPCSHRHCMRDDCENCPAWSPCIYYGKDYKQIKLPRWNWLVELLYKIEGWLLKL